jgi:hypothetical protein
MSEEGSGWDPSSSQRKITIITEWVAVKTGTPLIHSQSPCTRDQGVGFGRRSRKNGSMKGKAIKRGKTDETMMNESTAGLMAGGQRSECLPAGY